MMPSALRKSYNLEEHAQEQANLEKELSVVFSTTMHNVWVRWHVDIKTGNKTLLSVHETLAGAIHVVPEELKINKAFVRDRPEAPSVVDYIHERIERRMLQA